MQDLGRFKSQGRYMGAASAPWEMWLLVTTCVTGQGPAVHCQGQEKIQQFTGYHCPSINGALPGAVHWLLFLCKHWELNILRTAEIPSEQKSQCKEQKWSMLVGVCCFESTLLCVKQGKMLWRDKLLVIHQPTEKKNKAKPRAQWCLIFLLFK